MDGSVGNMDKDDASNTKRCPAEVLTQPDEALTQVRRLAEAFFKGANGSHDWDHTLRVYRLCEHIGRAENADLFVLRMAAYLHDIGRTAQDASKGVICHALQGVALAEPILAPISLEEVRRRNILHCIRSHRFRGDQRPQTPEARILFDADKLDAIGAVGVARAFLFAGEVGARLHNDSIDVETTEPYSIEDTGFREYRVKLCKIRDRMLTPTGRQLAEARHAFMTAFFERFLKEYAGEE